MENTDKKWDAVGRVLCLIDEKSQQKHSYEFKSGAVRLSEKIGVKEAAAKLGISIHRIYDWRRKAYEWRIQVITGYQAPGAVVSIIDEFDVLCNRIKTLEYEKQQLICAIDRLHSLSDSYKPKPPRR